VKDALTSYEQGLLAIETEREDLARVRAEVQAERDSLESAAKDLLARAQDLERGREELDLRANRVAEEELKNLKASTAVYEQMPPADAAKILNDMDVDVAARILKTMSPRKSGKVLAALPTARAVDVTRRMQAIITEPPKTGGAKRDSPGAER
jgi:flagellar motility protein MotE (MotC chaperone)